MMMKRELKLTANSGTGSDEKSTLYSVSVGLTSSCRSDRKCTALKFHGGTRKWRDPENGAQDLYANVQYKFRPNNMQRSVETNLRTQLRPKVETN